MRHGYIQDPKDFIVAQVNIFVSNVTSSLGSYIDSPSLVEHGQCGPMRSPLGVAVDPISGVLQLPRVLPGSASHARAGATWNTLCMDITNATIHTVYPQDDHYQKFSC